MILQYRLIVNLDGIFMRIKKARLIPGFGVVAEIAYLLFVFFVIVLCFFIFGAF